MITMIAAMDRQAVIGHEGRMPWHLPADLAYFKRVTLGKPVVMGRKTFESIGRPLPGRQNIVLSRHGSALQGTQVVDSVKAVLEACAEAAEVMIIGGGQIYRLFMPLADRLLITHIDTVAAAGTITFPEIETTRWQETAHEFHRHDDRHPFDYSFCEYRRR